MKYYTNKGVEMKKKTNTFALVGAVCTILGIISYLFISYTYAVILIGVGIPLLLVGAVQEGEK